MGDEPSVVWTRPERGTRGPAAAHSRRELTVAAIQLADRDGLSAVSMRRVAGALGTGPASLYRYVSGRDDLLDLMADAATGEIDLDVPLRGDPVADLVALANRTRAVHVRHPWLSDIPPEALRLGPRGLDYLEYALRALADVRLPGGTKLEIVALMNALVAQFARVELRSEDAGSDRRAAQAAHLGETVARGGHPHLAAAMADATAPNPPEDPGALFERTMHRVLTGLVTLPSP
ncbi:TetR/AcrR family transcriptional regulator C-terminal domain-containing protein [Streptomyces calidiresistens]|uniref:TetR family transcriptional regulator n=1 Tax=Streptomyces calidiresistens TaxID=1485586 RepID=A0A7W3XVX1_9ACTN|nr:TetR/AcrR family transcriptional regulator C-terminal domain-containing protein [Streptomyces calidiresistens]MBB0229191.1 TetR family transcriptional regulator [Streptomyces calidiresistens]